MHCLGMSLSVLLAAAFVSPQDGRSAREVAAEPLYRAAIAASREGRVDALDALAAALAAGACPTRALCDEAFARLHTEPRFRALMRDHAPQSSIMLAPDSEPGATLVVAGTVRDENRKPAAGVLVYVFHTDASGRYDRDGLDERNPRLFGYLRTDARGHYQFRTIRPGAYDAPDETVEQHIHLELSPPGGQTVRARLGFADDPFWRDRTVPRWAVPVQRDADGTQRCVFDLEVPAPPRRACCRRARSSPPSSASTVPASR